jgi:hypothetical protein
MKFNPDGEPLTVKVKFGGNNLGVCILKFRVSNDSPWKILTTFDSRITNQSISLDPESLIATGRTNKDFLNTAIGWFYVADEPATPTNIPAPLGTIDYQFNLDVLQGTSNLKEFSARSIGASPPVLLSGTYMFSS